jgi:Arc/MetJ family transcription regulator
MRSAAEKTCSRSLRNLLIRTASGHRTCLELRSGARNLSWEDIVDVVKRYLWYPNLCRVKESDLMAMTKTPIEIDQEALRIAAEVLGTTTKKDTVNAALREVGQRLVRLRALAGLGEMADRGDFDEFLGNKATYRR